MPSYRESLETERYPRYRKWRDIVLRTPGDAPFVIVAWLGLSIAAGLRIFGIEHDYFQYRDFYASIRHQLNFSDYRYEPGFVLLAWLSKNYLSLDFGSFLFLVASISLAIKIALLRLGRSFWPILLFYTLSLYLVHEMTQIRASLGIAFGYLAAHLSFRSRFAWALVCLGIGVSMHYSVLIFLVLLGIPMIWNLTRPHPPLAAAALVVSAAAIASIAILYLSSLNPLIDAYATQFEDQINLFSIRNLLIVVFVIVAIVKYSSNSPELRAHIFFLFAGLALFFGTSNVPPVAHRFLELTVFSMFVLSSRTRGSERNIFQSILLCLAVYLFIRQGDYSILSQFQ